eukprot:6018454-Pleurochrysis_carterae.AAC.1
MHATQCMCVRMSLSYIHWFVDSLFHCCPSACTNAGSATSWAASFHSAGQHVRLKQEPDGPHIFAFGSELLYSHSWDKAQCSIHHFTLGRVMWLPIDTIQCGGCVRAALHLGFQVLACTARPP